jgi:hypothetical protein
VLIIGCLVKFKGVDCGSGRVRECAYEIENCWMSTPSRVGLDEIGFDTDIGGSAMMRS